MSYNLLLNTNFKKETENWTLINCEYKHGYLISNKRVFGIKQDLILPDKVKLYFRWNYNVLSSNITELSIGIQNDDTLEVSRKKPKQNKDSFISIVDNAKQEKVSLHLIFESEDEINKIKIWEPILCNLNYIHKTSLLKWNLDKDIKYLSGYTYNNIYKTSEIKDNLDDFKTNNIENAKIGSIISVKDMKSFKINAKFNIDTYYLVKVDFEDINKYGETYLKYGFLKSTKFEDEQVYLIFKYKEGTPLELILKNNEELDYKVNLKHILIVDIGGLNLLKEDIPYLPFIGD